MKIYYTPEALADLQQIQQSVVEKFFDEELAEQVLKTITKNIRNLEIFPFSGAELYLSVTGNSGYRYLFVKKNYVFYQVEKDSIRIVRVLNEKQDYLKSLFGISEAEED